MELSNEDDRRPPPADHINEGTDRKTSSFQAPDKTLLKALQDLIERVIGSKQSNALNQLQSCAEAEHFIIALQEFIASTVASTQLGAQNIVIDVGSDEKEIEFLRGDLQEDPMDVEYDDEDDEIHPETFNEMNGNRSKNSSGLVTFNKPLLVFEEKLQKELREYVFNCMPIRLLCFEEQGSNFQITLVERDVIYRRLASALEGETPEGTESDRKAIRRLIPRYASFAILSHTWLRTVAGEVTYGDWSNGRFDSNDPGYQKLVTFCKVAWKDHQIAFGWMDTVCINKDSSSELDESIRSMYNWYNLAAVCITYLAGTETLADMHLDPWFTRGWTLQELLAPKVIKFYNCHWERLVGSSENDKEHPEIRKQIEQATTITKDELQHIHWAPISRRMQMAATREVTREEDTAYSLMGIFGISMSTAYGEGSERAFHRLLQEIMASSIQALDILNWAGDIPSSQLHLDDTSAVLPTSPRCYLQRASKKALVRWQPIEPLALSHLGLRVSVILMPGASTWNTELACNSIGDYTGTVDISPIWHRHRHNVPTTFNLLDNKISGEDGWNDTRQWYQMTFAVFNFTGARNVALRLPKTCIAIGLLCAEPAGNVSKFGYFDIIRTEKPILFELSKRNASLSEMDSISWEIPTDELAKHGMQLISLYL